MRRAKRGKGRLVERLRDRLRADLAALTRQEVAEPNIYLPDGYWLRPEQDVMRWTGDVEIGGLPHSVGSWDTVTECVRRGLKIEDCRTGTVGHYAAMRSYADFEVHAREADDRPDEPHTDHTDWPHQDVLP